MRHGFSLGRMRTGTPPRLHRDSINFDGLLPQPSDDDIMALSYLTQEVPLKVTEIERTKMKSLILEVS